MGFVRVETRSLYGPLRSALVSMLKDLDGDAWHNATSCPGWSVHDLVNHLVGVELGNVSRRRDSWRVDALPGVDLPAWVRRFNDEWVEASRRLSPQIATELLTTAGGWFDTYLSTLDLDATGSPVWWVSGTAPVPVWLDVAREFTERWLHQQQIREAVGAPGLFDAEYVAPFLGASVHSLPRTLAGIERPAGTTLEFVVEGEGGGSWYVVRAGQGWTLDATGRTGATARVVTTVDGAWKLFVGHPDTPPLGTEGDPELAQAVARGRAIIT